MSIAYDYAPRGPPPVSHRQAPAAADRRPACPVRAPAAPSRPSIRPPSRSSPPLPKATRPTSTARSRRRGAPSKAPGAPCAPPNAAKSCSALADLMKQHADEIAALESLDAGKPIAGVLRQDLPAAIDTLTYYAGWADKISGEVVSTRDDALTYTVREPVGVVAAIVPWNFPLMIGMWKLAPALACGCTIVMKPAELTSLSALRIGELALEAGLPPGVLNIVTGPGRVVGDALVNHPDVDKVTFTGSPGVGRGILRGAAGNFKRVSLELGGKSANVIFDDADIEAASKAAASGIFFNAGQVCSAGSRVLAHEKVYDEVVERLTQRAQVDPHRRSRRPRHGARPGHLREADEEHPRLRRYRPRGRRDSDDGRRARRRSRLFHQPRGVRQRRARDAHLAGGDLRPCRRASSSSATKPTRCGSPTARPTASPPASGAATSDACSALPRRRKPARSGSTPMAIPTCGCHGAACAIPASAANTARPRSRISPSRRRSG